MCESRRQPIHDRHDILINELHLVFVKLDDERDMDRVRCALLVVSYEL